MRKRLLWSVPVAVTVIAGLVRADDESDRRQLVEQVDTLLAGMSDDLGRVYGDSGTSYIDYALRKADTLKEKLSQLDRVKGDDSKAREMASYYPGYVDKFKGAANNLRLMKEGQRSLDGIPSTCTDKLRELAGALRAFTDVPDPRGLEKVPQLGRDYGRFARSQIEIADRKSYEMSRWYDRADDFSESSGKWSDVRSNLLSAERYVMEYFNNAYAQLKRDDVCGNLAKDERNPLVEQAVMKLLESKKGIELLYNAIDSQLSEIASYLDGLAGDSSDSDIDRAERKLQDLQRQYDQLDRVRGSDAEAQKRVEQGRRLCTAALDMTKNLRTLKRGQFLADKAPDACSDSATRLEQVIRGFLDSRKTEGISQIPLRARGFAEPIKAGLAKTDEQHTIMERAQTDALRFDTSEGRWRDMKDKARASTIGMYEYWTRARNAAHKACDELAKGDQNADVTRAVTNLSKVRAEGENDLLRLRADHRKWYDGLKELRAWYAQDTRSVRDMFCNLPESPGDSAEGDAYAAQLAQIADRMRYRINPRWRDLSDEASRMIAVSSKLAKEEDDNVRSGSLGLRKEIQATIASLERFLDGELKGANDPEVRAKIETGKNEHKRIQADSSKCTVSERTFGSRRVDCIRVDGSTCYVVEIKPNNSEAIAKGRAQVLDGISQIEGLLRDKKQKSDLVDQLEIFRSCFDDSKQRARLEPEVRVYEYCPPDGELFKDFVIP